MKLRHLLFLLLLLSGIVPLAVSSVLMIDQNRDLLQSQETDFLTQSALFLSRELNAHLGPLATVCSSSAMRWPARRVARAGRS